MADPIFGLPELSGGDSLGYLRQNLHNTVSERCPPDNRVASVSLSSPPGSVSRAGMWIVAGSASGQWAGQPANTIAIALSDNPSSVEGWKFLPPRAGMEVWLIGATAGQEKLIFNGTAWVTLRTYLGL